jgi:DNA processing protein
MFGLKETEVASLVRALVTEELDHDGIRDRFARATWSGIAEPGDRIAGLVVGALGAAAGLDAIVGRSSPDVIQSALAEAGADPVALDELQQAIDRWQPRLVSSNSLLALRQAARFGARLLTPNDPLWPDRLSDLESHAPIALWCRGTDAALAALSNSIALVGARAATGYGEHITMEASAGLVDRGYAIVSGAAYGIDGMAHRAALASRGLTVAFLAGGVDRFYPSGHDALLTRIVEEGAVLSELPCGQPPTKWRFLQRNRLIAASSLATIVLEAGWRSGSLNTAGHASALGRPLGAVPGPVTSAASAGCHRLIRDYQATLVSNADEMAELAPLSRQPELAERDATDPATPSGADNRILDAMSARAPRQTIDIAARAGMSTAEVQSILGAFELEGIVSEKEHGWVKR